MCFVNCNTLSIIVVLMLNCVQNGEFSRPEPIMLFILPIILFRISQFLARLFS